MPERVTPEAVRSVISRNVSVTGSGFVGLPLSASRALPGKSPERIIQLTIERMPVARNALAQLIEEMLGIGRHRFGINDIRATAKTESVFLRLPTSNHAEGTADVSQVQTVAEEITPYLEPRARVPAVLDSVATASRGFDYSRIGSPISGKRAGEVAA